MAARRPWLDPRLVVGSVLVAASVAGVWLVVEQSSRTHAVWAAQGALLPGDVLTSEDVEPVDVRIVTGEERYLSADRDPAGLIVTTPVGEGELLPVSALGDAQSGERTAIIVPLADAPPSVVRAGSRVDVWSAAPDADGFAPPRVLVADAIVAGVVQEEGVMADSATRLELLVDRSATAELLEALADEHAMSVVPGALPVGSAP